MALRFLLDTNICIYIAKERPPSVAKRFAKLEVGTVGMSLITFGELRFGAEKSASSAQALEALEQLIGLIPVIEPTAAVGATYGVLRAHLERAGTPIGSNDLWIAAHAQTLGVTLVTNNTREFERVPKLKVQNWVE